MNLNKKKICQKLEFDKRKWDYTKYLTISLLKSMV